MIDTTGGDNDSVKLEPPDDEEEDPLAFPQSPVVDGPDTPAGTPGVEDSAKAAARLQRLKKPLRELLGRIIGELRKRDDVGRLPFHFAANVQYGLFGEAVDTEYYPDYQDVIGGEDKMMDLGLMQEKADNRDYHSLDDLENDLRKLVTAAHTFNPPGSVPHTSASRMLAHGLRHIERSRPLVRSPSPSPDSVSTPRDSTREATGREATAAAEESKRVEIDPLVYIPEEMLLFPPNSLEARAVGWNLTGGRPLRPRRIVRARERFAGKWRAWDFDGTRSVAEMDEPSEILSEWHGPGKPREVVDWMKLRKEEWWDWGGYGGPNGQPPIAQAPFPRPPIPPKRTLDALSWGWFPEIDAEATILAQRMGQPALNALGQQLRPGPKQTRSAAPGTFVNLYEEKISPKDWLFEMMHGDPAGEAYKTSINRFLAGAAREVDIKPVLREFVDARWHNNILRLPAETTLTSTLYQLASVPRKGTPNPTQTHLLELARQAHARQSLIQLCADSNPLSIEPLLRLESDFFSSTSIRVRGNVQGGLDWTSAEIDRLAAAQRSKHDSLQAQRDELPGLKSEGNISSNASSPLSQLPDEEKPVDDAKGIQEDEEMKALRLELVALCKFYPLAALKKMDAKTAEQLMPLNVRRLMTAPSPAAVPKPTKPM